MSSVLNTHPPFPGAPEEWRQEDESALAMIGTVYRHVGGDEERMMFSPLGLHLDGDGIIRPHILMIAAKALLQGCVQRVRGAGDHALGPLSINCDFLDEYPARGWIAGQARIIRRGRNVAFLRGKLICGDRTILAVNGVWRMRQES